LQRKTRQNGKAVPSLSWAQLFLRYEAEVTITNERLSCFHEILIADTGDSHYISSWKGSKWRVVPPFFMCGELIFREKKAR